MVEILKLDDVNTLGVSALRPYTNNLSKALSKMRTAPAYSIGIACGARPVLTNKSEQPSMKIRGLAVLQTIGIPYYGTMEWPTLVASESSII